jgi:NAD(P)-dependent dehydrogenase (short-subunit alcohol dehydrogenase family)
VLAARRTDRLAHIAHELGGDDVALAVTADVTRRADVTRLFEAARARFGDIDVWVNNAGRGITRAFDQVTDDDVDAMVRDNLKSALYGMQAVLPHFRARGRGRLVNVSTMLSRTPVVAPRAAYGAVKAALNTLTDTMRVDLARDCPGIVLITVYPGVVATEFGLNALGGGADMRGFPGAQSVEDVATVMADGIAAGRAEVYTRPEFLERSIDHIRGLAT